MYKNPNISLVSRKQAKATDVDDYLKGEYYNFFNFLYFSVGSDSWSIDIANKSCPRKFIFE